MSWGKRAYYAGACLAAHATNKRAVGTHPYRDRDEWDALIILDSCTVELFRQALSFESFEGLPSSAESDAFESVWSVGSCTTEWLSRVFTNEYRDEIRRTAYVTASPHSQTVFREKSVLTSKERLPLASWYPDADVPDPDEFARFHEVWQTHADLDMQPEDAEIPVTYPRPVTDAAVRAARDGYGDEFDRMVIHYLQPHEPFLTPTAPSADDYGTKGIWQALNQGLADPDRVWRAYRETLYKVLEDVSLLVHNLPARRVVVTADHGNAFGEWGIYGHPFAWPQPEARRVPWVRIDADDSGAYDPGPGPREESTRESPASVEDQLAALGYL